jgi:selenocysteine lyase/cysteine desulfurase
VRNVYGNRLSYSITSGPTSQRIEEVRNGALRFCNADTKNFDLVFVTNATAGIKLVGEIFRDYAVSRATGKVKALGFWYGYHCDADTSVVGVRGERPTGVVRVSFGAWSTKSDAHLFIEFLRKMYVGRSHAYYLSIPIESNDTESVGDMRCSEGSFMGPYDGSTLRDTVSNKRGSSGSGRDGSGKGVKHVHF